MRLMLEPKAVGYRSLCLPSCIHNSSAQECNLMHIFSIGSIIPFHATYEAVVNVAIKRDAMLPYQYADIRYIGDAFDSCKLVVLFIQHAIKSIWTICPNGY
jgi:hypothetical protein